MPRLTTIFGALTRVERRVAESTGCSHTKRSFFANTGMIYTLLRKGDLRALRTLLTGAPVVTRDLLAEAGHATISQFMTHIEDSK